MKYKLNENVTHTLLINYGFYYRKHYDNYYYSINQPKSEAIFKELIDMGYKREDAQQENYLKSTYLNYGLQVNIKTREVSMFINALDKYPHEERLHQYDIAEEYIELILDLIKKRVIIKVKKDE
jgi:hypothetical protein